MELSDQVCSLELAKKLKELGIKQESYFYWMLNYSDNYKLFHAENDDCNQHNGPGDITWLKMKQRNHQAWSAFTVAELIYMLQNYGIDINIFSTDKNIADKLAEKLLVIHKENTEKD